MQTAVRKSINFFFPFSFYTFCLFLLNVVFRYQLPAVTSCLVYAKLGCKYNVFISEWPLDCSYTNTFENHVILFVPKEKLSLV